MKFIIINDEHNEMVSLIMQELEQILKNENGIEDIKIEKETEQGKKCDAIIEMVVTLALGVGSAFIWDSIKRICLKYKDRTELKKDTKITVKEGDKVITIEINEVMK